MHIIKSLPIKSTDYIHYVFENNCSMKCPWLWRVTCRINFHKPSLLDVKLMDVVESLLISVDTAENVDVATTYDCGVPVSGLGWRAISSMNFIPVI